MSILVYHFSFKKELLTPENSNVYFDALLNPTKKNITALIKNGWYNKVAIVDTDSLDKAFELTNSITNYWG
jgi:hypothetical protein